MFKLAIEVCFENHFGFDSRYILIARVDQIRILFFGTPGIYLSTLKILILLSKVPIHSGPAGARNENNQLLQNGITSFYV